MNAIDMDKARGIAGKIGFSPSGSSFGRCLIIGGSPSLKGTRLGEYVDQFDGDVIRVNAPASQRHVADCGSRTDVIFRSKWLDDNVYSSGSERKITIDTPDLKVLSEDFMAKDDKFITTGLACIVLALSVYNRVEVLGFGDDGTEGSSLFVTLHAVPHRDGKKLSCRCPHDIDMEHVALRDMEKNQFCGKLHRLDSMMRRRASNAAVLPNWDRFDRKTLISFTGYNNIRVPGMVKEMKRAGMDGVEIQWQFPSPFHEVFMKSLRHDKFIHRGGYFNCTMGHYRAIATAYHLGCSEALFMEDDIRFLKNTSDIAAALNAIPQDYDLITFDPSYRTWPEDDYQAFANWREKRKVNEWWAGFDRMFSMGCYALSRRGMERFMSCYDAAANNRGTLKVCDHYLDRNFLGKDAKMYFARKNICIQARMGSASSNMDTITTRYVKMGLDFSEYEMSDTVCTSADAGRCGNGAKVIATPAKPRRKDADDENSVDAVFVVGNGSLSNNEELRYALRNLCKHCKFIRDVYICGECPSWVDKSMVRHLPWPDRFTHAKDANIIDKLRHACETPGIAKRILFCSDDQFQTRECTWDDFKPRWLRRYVPNDPWYENQKRVWHRRLRRTLEREVQRRKSIGMRSGDVFYYQPHIWMPIDRDSFMDYAKWCDYEHRDDTIIASGYYNFVYTKGSEDFDHVFLSCGAVSVPKETHVAYNDGSCSAALGILNKMFPEKCRFETGMGGGGGATLASGAPGQTANSWAIDPDPATPEEQTSISRVFDLIRAGNADPHMSGDVSLAEELRLRKVKGWRVVWQDLILRAKESSPREMSGPAKDVVSAYVGGRNEPSRSCDNARGEIMSRLHKRATL